MWQRGLFLTLWFQPLPVGDGADAGEGLAFVPKEDVCPVELAG